MDTRHLVDYELIPLVDQYAGSSVNAQTLDALRQSMTQAAPVDDGAGDGLAVEVERRSVPRLNAPGSVAVVIVKPEANTQSRGGILHLHGGGMVMGSPDPWLPLLRQQAAQLDCVIVSVDYPLAPEAVFPAAVEDCYSALCWMAGEADALGVDPARIGVAGESAGGGLAAALALLARDRGGPPLAFQNLLYPMLDDRTGSVGDSSLQNSNPVTGQFMWKREDNCFGWASLLGTAFGSAGVSPYAAPARAEDLAGLPPAYIAVGSLDLFLDEDVAYAMRLARAGVPVELNVYPGAVHGFDFAADAAVSKRAAQQRMDAFQRALGAPAQPSGVPAADLESIYRRYVASLNERRLSELGEFVHDPIRFNGEVVSLADYASAISSNIDAVPDFHWEIQDLVTTGDALAVRITDTGTPQAEWLGISPSGRFMTAQEFAVYRFRDGKIAEMWFLLDIAAIKSQLE